MHEVSCDKNGSRTIDAIWATATSKQKHSIAEELSKHENRIQGDKFGVYVWRNLSLAQFKHKRSEWENLQTGSAKRKRMFNDIIGEKCGGIVTYCKNNVYYNFTLEHVSGKVN